MAQQPPSTQEWDQLDLKNIRERAERLQARLLELGDAVSLGDFSVQRLLGTGANAFAYLASCKADGQLAAHVDTLVVLKVLIKLRQAGAPDALLQEQEKAFLQFVETETKGPGFPEFRENIVHVLGSFRSDVTSLKEYSGLDKSFTDGTTSIIVMPFFSGGDLAALLKGPRLPEHKLLGILTQMLDGVVKLQKHGVAHRDLKSDNIFFCGDRMSLALADFGEAGPLQLQFVEGASSPGGALASLAPEVRTAIAAMAPGTTQTRSV
jgi:serine/threonine protein kinase